jgi:hypothetical protein
MRLSYRPSPRGSYKQVGSHTRCEATSTQSDRPDRKLDVTSSSSHLYLDLTPAPSITHEPASGTCVVTSLGGWGFIGVDVQSPGRGVGRSKGRSGV